MSAFREVARDVYLLRYPVLDVNVTLVLGGGSALVVDTLSTEAQAVELLAGVRRITRAPLVAVNTHHHYDHCFGNACFADEGAPIWAHEEAVALLRRNGDALRQAWSRELRATDPALAEGVAGARLRVPDHPVKRESTVDLGDRAVHLRYFGRGHTAGDLVIAVPDADLVVAGDLVEESGPPQAGDDAYPLEWPGTLDALLATLGDGTLVVPGHGAIVNRAFVRNQRAVVSPDPR